MKTEKFVLALIKDDLINSKLVNTLNDIGLAADHYTLHMSTTIMNLMKIKAAPLQWEKIHDEYLERVRKVLQIDIQDSPQLVDILAEEIYYFLRQKREEIQAP